MSNQQALKFGEAVEHKGQTAIIVGVRGVLVDLLKVREVRNGADLVQNVIGTARQVELVHFEHDVPAEEIERAEDWFFSLNAKQVNALLNEKDRRDHERQQAEQAKADQAASATLLQDVKIRPSNRVLQTAEKLWKDAVRAEQHADEHEEIELPSFESKPDLWKPWIEKAKAFITVQDQQPKQPVQIQPDRIIRNVPTGSGHKNFGMPSAKERDQAEQAKANGGAAPQPEIEPTDIVMGTGADAQPVIETAGGELVPDPVKKGSGSIN